MNFYSVHISYTSSSQLLLKLISRVYINLLYLNFATEMLENVKLLFISSIKVDVCLSKLFLSQSKYKITYCFTSFSLELRLLNSLTCTYYMDAHRRRSRTNGSIMYYELVKVCGKRNPVVFRSILYSFE